jgi:hypothetical protein
MKFCNQDVPRSQQLEKHNKNGCVFSWLKKDTTIDVGDPTDLNPKYDFRSQPVQQLSLPGSTLDANSA